MMLPRGGVLAPRLVNLPHEWGWLKKTLVAVAGLVGVAALGLGGFVWLKASAYDASLAKVYDIPLLEVERSTDPAVLARGEHVARHGRDQRCGFAFAAALPAFAGGNEARAQFGCTAFCARLRHFVCCPCPLLKAEASAFARSGDTHAIAPARCAARWPR